MLTREPRPSAAPLAAEVERILAGAHEFAELRLLATIRSGVGEAAARGADGGRAAARRRRRRGPRPGWAWTRASDPAELQAAALDAAARWQRRAESPMSSRAVSDAARLVVRSCEGILASLPR